MKKFIIIFSLLFLSSCENKVDISNDITKLELKRKDLQSTIILMENKIHSANKLNKKLEEELYIKKLISKGKQPKYIIKFRLKQSHLSLSIKTHIKDEMNAIEFDLPVDKEFYNKVDVGDEVVDEFRAGSFIMNGSFGDWEMTVIKKHIK